MRTTICCRAALWILLASALIVDDSALARGQTRAAQLDAQPEGEAKVAQRKSKKRGKASAAARSRTAGKGKRAASRATPAPGSTNAPSAASDDDGAREHSPILSTRTAPARVDFDERLVQGQSSKSGAIYIFERKGAELRTMVRRRQSFREEILRTVE